MRTSDTHADGGGGGGRIARWTLLALLCAFCCAASLGVLAQTSTDGGAAGVRPGKTVTVIANLEQVFAIGYAEGTPMTISVFRAGAILGSAQGVALPFADGSGLELNHGPASTPQPGECWTFRTPDIQAGDLVRVAAEGGVDEVVADDLRFLGDPRADGDAVVVDFVALRAGSTSDAPLPVPLAALADGASFRLGAALRYRSDELAVEAVPGAPAGSYRLRYTNFQPARNRDGLDAAGVRAELLKPGSGHSIGYAADATGKGMIIEGTAVQVGSAGPGPGCPADAPIAACTGTRLAQQFLTSGLFDAGTCPTGANEIPSEATCQLACSPLTGSCLGTAGECGGLTCRDGDWAGATPRCIPNCALDTLPLGAVRGSCPQRLDGHGASCTLGVATGYMLANPLASLTLTCQAGFLSPLPVFTLALTQPDARPCSAEDLAVSAILVDGTGLARAGQCPSTPGAFQPSGTECMLGCAEGATCARPPLGSGCVVALCVDSQWAGLSPDCRLECALPETLPEGQLAGSCPARLDGHGGQCTLAVATGFELVTGSLQLVCQSGRLSPLPSVAPDSNAQPCSVETLAPLLAAPHTVGACGGTSGSAVHGTSCALGCTAGQSCNNAGGGCGAATCTDAAWTIQALPQCVAQCVLDTTLPAGWSPDADCPPALSGFGGASCTVAVSGGWEHDPTVADGTPLSHSVTCTAGQLSVLPAVRQIAGTDGNRLRAGHNVLVIHNIDFVAAVGYGEPGTNMRVEVFRDGVRIGEAAGPAIATPDGMGLEVNHGPEGAAQPGDCWIRRTPDIRPGDVIHVSDPRGVDQVTVDDIRITGLPREAISGDILVPFVAYSRPSGAPVPLAAINSAEFRATSRLRFESTDIRVEAAPTGVPGEYQMRYRSPFTPSRNRENLNQAQLRALLLGDGHTIGFGHTVVAQRAMLFEGLFDSPGPAAGCPADEPVAPCNGLTLVAAAGLVAGGRQTVGTCPALGTQLASGLQCELGCRTDGGTGVCRACPLMRCIDGAWSQPPDCPILALRTCSITPPTGASTGTCSSRVSGQCRLEVLAGWQLDPDSPSLEVTCNDGVLSPMPRLSPIPMAGCLGSAIPASFFVDPLVTRGGCPAADAAGDVAHGATCALACDAARASCQECGQLTCTNGAWSGAAPTCVAHCAVAPPVGSSAGTCLSLLSGFGGSCRLALGDGFELAAGSPSLDVTCQNGVLSPLPVVARITACAGADIPAAVLAAPRVALGTCPASGALLATGATCQLACATGSHCHAPCDGVLTCTQRFWSGAAPSCAANCPQVALPIGLDSGTCFGPLDGHGEQCRLALAAGWQLAPGQPAEVLILTCRDGTLSQLPHVIPPGGVIQQDGEVVTGVVEPTGSAGEAASPDHQAHTNVGSDGGSGNGNGSGKSDSKGDRDDDDEKEKQDIAQKAGTLLPLLRRFRGR